MIKQSLLSAALIGGTFICMSASSSAADIPVVRSQAVHVSSSGQATTTTTRKQSVNPENSEILESLIFQVQDLQALVSEQRGLIEELSYQVQVMEQEQKERYIDLDKRIQAVNKSGSTSPLTSTPAQPINENEQAALSDEAILSEYNAATALMQERKFDESIVKLSEFSQAHPDHPLAANSLYWVGEIFLVQREADKAKVYFERIVSDHPSHSKVPDSLYKLGVIAQQSSNSALAKTYFQRVLNEYPQTQSAKLSKARLESN